MSQFLLLTLARGKGRLGFGCNSQLGKTPELESCHGGAVRESLPQCQTLFPDACPPSVLFFFFFSFTCTYIPVVFTEHLFQAGARAGVYRRHLFSPLPLNGSSLLSLSPHNSVVTGLDGGIFKLCPCRRHLRQEFPATPKESGRLMRLWLELTREWKEVGVGGDLQPAVGPSPLYNSH